MDVLLRASLKLSSAFNLFQQIVIFKPGSCISFQCIPTAVVAVFILEEDTHIINPEYKHLICLPLQPAEIPSRSLEYT